MSVFIKINSRMKLIYYDENVFIFSIDENKIVKFYPQTKNLYTILLDFVHLGRQQEIQELRDPTLSSLFIFIDELKKKGLIDYHFNFNTDESAVVYPREPQFNDTFLTKRDLTLVQKFYSLSRFTYFRNEQNGISLESPLSPFKIILTYKTFTHFLPYITGRKELITKNFSRSSNLFFYLLNKHQILHPIDEQEIEYLKFWEFHDLLFHWRSRRGAFDDNHSFGATYRFKKNPNLADVSKKDDLEGVIELYKPDLKELIRQHPSFSEVLENRRSIRNFNESKSLCINKLGEFLYRSIAIRDIVQTPMQDAVFRPYPGAGAIHEIDFYLVVNNCVGLEADVYYYQSKKHVLFRKNVKREFLEKINLNAKSGMGTLTNPHIVLVLTSHFKKIAWKYEKIAYRCTLISMGAIFQTMSLVATSMNLGSCIIGSGNSSLFAEAVRINMLEEGAIGEFAVGIPS